MGYSAKRFFLCVQMYDDATAKQSVKSARESVIIRRTLSVPSPSKAPESKVDVVYYSKWTTSRASKGK